MTEQPKRFYLFVLTAVVIAQILLLVPGNIYITNYQEFFSSFQTIATIYSMVAVILFALILLPGLFFKGNKFTRYLTLLSAISLLIWLQSQVLLWDYGRLDGSRIDWSRYSWQGWVDTTVWAGLLWLAWRYYAALFRFLSILAIVLFMVQTITVLAYWYPVKNKISTREQFVSADNLKHTIQFSSQFNVVHLLLDGFQGDIFEDLINNPALPYKKDFDGFVFFNQTLSVFPYTRFAVPAFLSAKIYHNQTPKDNFIRRTIQQNSIFNSASKAGFEVDLVGDEYWIPFYAQGRYNNAFILPEKGEADPRQMHLNNAIKLLDLSLFRMLPHVIKPFIYRDQRWLFSDLMAGSPLLQYRYFSHTIFLDYLIRNMQVSRNKPVYKFIHVMNTHNPMVVDKNCVFAGGTLPTTRESLTAQSNCTLKTVKALLDKMKQLGIYDNSLIIIHSDHGGWVQTRQFTPARINQAGSQIQPWMESLATPLLLIKKPHAKGLLQTNSALVSLLNIPDTLASLLNFPDKFGYQSVFAPQQKIPTRSYYFYFWQKNAWHTDFTGPIYQFDIQGSHHDSPWHLKGKWEAPKKQAN